MCFGQNLFKNYENESKKADRLMISYIAYDDFALKLYCSTKFGPWVCCGFGANPDTNFELLNYIYRDRYTS